MANKLDEFAVNLAVLDKWKEWDSEQSIETISNFSGDILRDIGDKNVDAILELREKLLETINKLKKITNHDRKRIY